MVTSQEDGLALTSHEIELASLYSGVGQANSVGAVEMAPLWVVWWLAVGVEKLVHPCVHLAVINDLEVASQVCPVVIQVLRLGVRAAVLNG